jgi:hypothetical protein
MTASELDAFLTAERTCRVANATPTGPHLSALWFVWDTTSLWLYSLTDSKRWRDLIKDPSVAVLIDAGHDYDELRGAELRGRVEIVGEIPRAGQADPALEAPEQLFARKYIGTDTMFYDNKHAWLRLTPEYVRSWDFRKLGTAT